jgi:hypothetical protein
MVRPRGEASAETARGSRGAVVRLQAAGRDRAVPYRRGAAPIYKWLYWSQPRRVQDTPTSDDPKPAVETPPSVERRRPGRKHYTNPELIALLRGSSGAAANDEEDTVAWDRGVTTHHRESALGILLMLAIAVAMWGAIGLTIWLLIGSVRGP